MSFELITKNGKTFALVPVEGHEDALAKMELADDVRLVEAALASIENGDDELVPYGLIKRRLAGENPVKIWREFREKTQAELASAAGVSRPMVCAIESGTKSGSVVTMKKIASALGCDIGNLV